mmetsp:Transcript_30778/g.77857  ORF Transcript_30778/g.77857 Transcript_30778/m.77857 type:complete len:248 (-) Transcript_30778:4791-5534(-)
MGLQAALASHARANHRALQQPRGPLRLVQLDGQPRAHRSTAVCRPQACASQRQTRESDPACTTLISTPNTSSNTSSTQTPTNSWTLRASMGVAPGLNARPKFALARFYLIWKRHILRNAFDWRYRVEGAAPLRLPVGVDPVIIQYDVVALYPSIPHHRGLEAMKWFLEHPDVGILRQREGTAMGTGLSVVYANTFMLWFEDPIVRDFENDIQLYTRYIDDGQLIFVGSPERRTAFLDAFNTRLLAVP